MGRESTLATGVVLRGGPAPSADDVTLSQTALVVLEDFTWTRPRDARFPADLSAADGMLEACTLLQNTIHTTYRCSQHTVRLCIITTQSTGNMQVSF